MTKASLVLLVAVCLMCVVTPQASAAPPGGTDQSRKGQKDGKSKDDKKCQVGVPGVDSVANAVCDTAGDLKDTVAGAPGKIAAAAAGQAAEAVSGSVFDQLTKWMTEAASWLTGQIAKAIDKTTTPELDAGWYRERFASMAALGLGLALLVAVIALGSAAIRRDPEALGATFIGMFRAGLGTGLVLALTVLALGVADGLTNAVAQDAVGKNASKFWSSAGAAATKLGDAPSDAAEQAAPDSPGAKSVAGAAANVAPQTAQIKRAPAAIVFLLALGQVVVGLAVWIELLLRSAAIYVAVLFMPAALAASIWPSLRSWQSRLGRGLFVLIAMKPVVVTVLALAGSAAAAALAGEANNGLGVILAALVMLALAAFAPWALLNLVSIDHEGHWSARGGIDGARGAGLAGPQQLGGGIRAGGRAMQGMGSGRGRGGAGASSGSAASAGGGGGAGGGAGGAAAGGKAVGGAAGGGAAGGAAAAPVAGAVAVAAGMWQGGRQTGQRAGQTAAGAQGGSGEQSGEEHGGGGQGGPARAPQPRAPGLPQQGAAGGGGQGGGGGAGGRSQAPSPRTGRQAGGRRPPGSGSGR